MSYEDLSYFGEEEFKKNLAIYEAMLKDGSSAYMEADELTDIAEYYLMKGLSEKAYDCIHYALKLHPGSVDPLIFLARQKMFADKLDEAIAIRNQITDQQDREVIFFNLELYLHQDKRQEAENYLAQISEDLNDDAEEFAYDVACVYLDYNIYDMARIWADKALSFHPESDRNLKLKAEVLIGLNQTTEAIAILNQALDINPYNIFAWHSMTEAYMQLNDFAKAIETVDFALAINEKDYHSLQLKANCLFYQGNYKEAHRYYSLYFEEFKSDEISYMYDGVSLLNLQAYDEAISQLEQGVSLSGEQSTERFHLYQQLSLAYSKKGMLDKAFDYIEKACQIHTLDYNVDICKGNMLLENGLQDQAYACFAKAMEEKDPDTLLKNHFLIGVSLTENSQYAKAENHFRYILENDKQTEGFSGKIFSYLSLCAMMQHHTSDFLKYLKLACECNDPYLEITIGRFIPNEVEPTKFYQYVLLHPEQFISDEQSDITPAEQN